MSALGDFHFLRPEWLLGLLPVALASLLLVRQRLEHGRWRDAIDPELAEWLVEGSWGRSARFGLLAVLLAWTVGLLALAGPTTERRPQAVSRSDDAMVVVLDLSLSMYAEDLAPSRLVRARLKIADVLNERGDGQTGLVVYAGDAHVVVPLTDDVRTIRNLLPSLEPGVMPVLGARADHALELAVRLLEEAEAAEGRILLLTDEVLDVEAARDALSPRYPLSVLGLGTSEGAPIPLAGIGRTGVLESQGRTVVARLDEGPLRALASAGGGRFARFTTDASDLDTLLDATLSEASDDAERAFDLWIDLGPWLVLALLPVAAFAFRRGVIACVLVGLLLVTPEPALAASWFTTPDQEAWRALREGRPAEAAESFTDPRWRATALYRAEAYADAATGFRLADPAGAANAEDLYNQGTALARAMNLEAARDTLAAAIEQDPAHEDARHNLEIVERLLEAERQAAENEQGSQQNDPDQENDSDSEASERNDSGASEDSGSQEDAEAGDGENGEQQPREQSPEESEAEEASDEDASDPAQLAQRSREQEQALEQWLRRVPDEPGALLRRKFRYETDRRYRQGLRRAPQDAQPW